MINRVIATVNNMINYQGLARIQTVRSRFAYFFLKLVFSNQNICHNIQTGKDINLFVMVIFELILSNKSDSDKSFPSN